MRECLFLMFAMLVALTGCDKEEEEKEPPIEGIQTIKLDKEELTLIAGESYQFKVIITPDRPYISDISWRIEGFNPSDGDRNNWPTMKDGLISCDRSCTFNVVVAAYSVDVKKYTAECKVTYLPSKQEIYTRYCYGLAIKDTTGILSGETEILPTIGSTMDTVYLAAFKKDTLWIGLFSDRTKQQLGEWKDIEPMSRIQRAHISYGNYEEFTIKKADVRFIVKDGDNSVVKVRLYDPLVTGSHAMLCFIKDGKSKRYFHKDGTENFIRNWHENSYLINIDVSQEPYNSLDDRFYTCFSDNGDVILSGKRPVEVSDQWFPISFDEYLYVGQPYGSIYSENIFISKRSVSKGESIWSFWTGRRTKDGETFVPSVKKKNGDIWTVRIKVTNYAGRGYTLVYDVNVKDGSYTEVSDN